MTKFNIQPVAWRSPSQALSPVCQPGAMSLCPHSLSPGAAPSSPESAQATRHSTDPPTAHCPHQCTCHCAHTAAPPSLWASGLRQAGQWAHKPAHGGLESRLAALAPPGCPLPSAGPISWEETRPKCWSGTLQHSGIFKRYNTHMEVSSTTGKHSSHPAQETALCPGTLNCHH